jgi:phage terminase large subunit-like protein
MSKSKLDLTQAEALLNGGLKFDQNNLRVDLARMGEDVVPVEANAAALTKFQDMVSEYEKRLVNAGTEKWFMPGSPYGIEVCHKHRAFFDAGGEFSERIFLASNRTGKSIAGAYETACHLTGEYPFWWIGKTFDHPIAAWAMGATARSTRDIVQKELLGPIGHWGTGMIPKEKLGRCWMLQGTPQGVDVIEVHHKSGGMSTLGFKNYEQDITAFYGTAMHVVWLDEECPHNIYNECLMRTMTTEGIVYVTFTPLKGLTPFVVNFLSKSEYLAGAMPIALPPKDADQEQEEGEDARFVGLGKTKAVVQAGWDDAPWLTEESKRKMLDDTEPHLRAARSKGIPAMGSGNVYPTPFEEISVAPFKIPDHYKRMYALDVGWNRTACLWAAQDPDTEVVYIYDEHYVGKQEPALHAAAIRGRGAWLTGVIDPASRGRSQTDGQQLMHIYKNDLGLTLFPAKNEVESGIANVWQMMSTGKLKIFSNLSNFAQEYVVYRRNKDGKIVKEKDHLMDCLRYIVNNLKRMTLKRTNQIGGKDGSRRYDL